MPRKLDLSQEIYGTLDPSDDMSALHEGERIVLLLFNAGGTAMKPVIEVDSVRISELGTHLEEFTGRDVTDPIFDDALSPGSTVDGMYNHATSTVFLTAVDSEVVAQEPHFYNAGNGGDNK